MQEKELNGAGNSLQKKVFDKISERLSSQKDLPTVISEVLNISIHSAYRRLRHDVILSLEELETLTSHFGLNFFEDSYKSKSSYYFKGANLDNTALNYRQSLHKYVDYIEQFKKVGILSLSYCGLDIMPLSLMGSPIMLGYQEFFWNDSFASADNPKSSKLSFANIDDELKDLAAYFHSFLQAIPSVEIWSNLCLESEISQLEYMRQTDRFLSHDDIGIVYKELERIVNWKEYQATAGLKTDMSGNRLTPTVPYALYKSDLFISENNFFLETQLHHFALVKHNFFSYMVTSNQSFVDLTRNTMNTIIGKSQPLSATNERARLAFFNNLRKRIHESYSAAV